MFVVITDWDEFNRVAKFADGFETFNDADEFLGTIENYPDAFSAQQPEGAPSDWLVDPGNKTVSFSPDVDVLRASCVQLIKSAFSSRIVQGIRWAWSAEEPENIIRLTAEMREVLASWHQLLNQSIPAVNPHGGFIKSNGTIFTGPGGIDLPDNAVNEIAEFTGLWASEISRIAIAEELSVASMDLAQLQAYDAATIDWTVTWDPSRPDWNDDLALYNP